MRSLNVDFTQIDKPKQQIKIEKFNEWSNPIGWWEVTTEGDIEGRSITKLGKHYGHIADIAFELAKKACYSLQFFPTKSNANGFETKRIATSRKVHISFNGGPFSQALSEFDILTWMDISGIKISKSNYHGAVTLEAIDSTKKTLESQA